MWYHHDIWSKSDENGISLLDRILRKLVELEYEKKQQRSENNDADC